MSEGVAAGVTLRPLKPDDRDFVLALAERLAAVGNPPWRDRDAMRAFHYHYAEQLLGARGPDQLALVAEDGSGNRLGVMHVGGERSGLTGEAQGYLATLAVAEGAEGHGVGRALMAAAEEWAREKGYRLLALEVFAGNTHAREFYRRLGYQEETLKLVKELGRESEPGKGASASPQVGRD
jgi:GNAT superfamily N-acetyltransferase